jgi:release factor glutamine methyltransferase
MNVNDWLSQATARLTAENFLTARLDTQILLSHVLKISRASLLAQPETTLSANHLHQADQLLHKRLHHQPIAYILGTKEFYGRNFVITPAVLVPRPETEAMIDLALSLPDRDFRLLDLGTGSGIIGLTLALERPAWQITLTDVDSAALAVAQQNAHALGVTSATFRQQNLLANDMTSYDIVVANLPYVPADRQHRPDLQAEPAQALFSGADGLNHYRRLFTDLAKRDSIPQYLITEALPDQHQQLIELAKNVGFHWQQTTGLAQLFSSSATDSD